MRVDVDSRPSLSSPVKVKALDMRGGFARSGTSTGAGLDISAPSSSGASKRAWQCGVSSPPLSGPAAWAVAAGEMREPPGTVVARCLPWESPTTAALTLKPFFMIAREVICRRSWRPELERCFRCASTKSTRCRKSRKHSHSYRDVSARGTTATSGRRSRLKSKAAAKRARSTMLCSSEPSSAWLSSSPLHSRRKKPCTSFCVR